jgi:hypothetical protein
MNYLSQIESLKQVDSSNQIESKTINHKQESSLDEREHTMYILMIFTSIFIITINFVFYKFIKLEYGNIYILSVFITLVLPFLINIYSIFWHINFQENRTAEENLEELEKENQSEKESKVPIILFGLGLFITKLNKNLILTIFPYLMGALFFGTILPECITLLVFDHYDLYRLTIVSELNFTSVILSYGFLIMSIYLTGYYYLNPKHIKL